MLAAEMGAVIIKLNVHVVKWDMNISAMMLG